MRREIMALAALVGMPVTAQAGIAGILGGASGCPYDTIQDAIDAAGSGSTVLVYPTTHMLGSELVVSKSLTLATGNATCSSEDPGVKAQLAGGLFASYRVLRATGTGTTNIELRNLSLSHGSPDALYPYGGLVFVDGAALTLDDVALSVTDALGGGCLYATGGASVFFENGSKTFYSCSARTQGGGAVLADGATIHVYDSVLDGTADNLGGVIRLYNSTLYLNSGAVVENGNADNGGCVYAHESTVVMDEGAIIQGCRALGTAGKGGGIYLVDATLEQRFSSILGNEAVRGGGIYASGSTIDLVGTPKIGDAGNGNMADEYGGGIYAENSTTIEVDGFALDFSSVSDDDPPDGGARIGHNLAWNSASALEGGGGGIYLLDSTLTGERLVVHHNEVGVPFSPRQGKGGGLAVVGATGKATLLDTVVADNKARTGGGIVVEAGSIVQMASNYATVEGGCAGTGGATASRVCSEVLHNVAVDGTKGAGVLVQSGGTFTTFATALRYNTVTTSSGLDGAALWVKGGGAATLNSSLVSANVGATNSVIVDANGQLEAKQSTFADTGSPVCYLFGALGSFFRNNAWDHTSPTSPALVVDGSLDGGCNVGKGFTGLTGINLDDTDPLFLDPFNQDFHIGSASPSYNRCGQGSLFDLDGVPRPQCGPGGLVYDAGAYEVTCL